jgi:hypothetical protein
VDDTPAAGGHHEGRCVRPGAARRTTVDGKLKTLQATLPVNYTTDHEQAYNQTHGTGPTSNNIVNESMYNGKVKMQAYSVSLPMHLSDREIASRVMRAARFAQCDLEVRHEKAQAF